MSFTNPCRLVLVLLFALGLAVSAASAGSVIVAWDASANATGYRVYWGTSPGVYGASPLDVGNVTETTINSLSDCTTYYFSVKAYNSAGDSGYATEVASWPRPVVTISAPSAAEQGRRLDLTIAGTNFQNGATVQFANTGVTVNSVTVTSCSQLVANVTVGASATVGSTSIDVTNPNAVKGTGASLFTVQAATIPTVVSTSPADGATGVATSVRPTVTFSEAMLASSITSGTVKLMDGATTVAQAAGSPSLSADGLMATITPASSLTAGKTYKIQVVGGASGAMDLANHAVAATFTQTTGFATVPDTTAPAVSAVLSGSVASTTASITWTTDENADSQVFVRKAGQTGYQQTTIDTALVTSHAVNLQGLEPSTTYQYHVRSADAASNVTTSSPDQTFTTSASTYSYLRFEAEAGTLVAPVRATAGAGTFGSAYVDTPSGTATGSASSPSGTATFGVNVPSAGTWFVWVRLYGANASSNAWFESVDGAARASITASSNGAWVWVAGRSYTLTQGLHSVELGGNEAQARADRVLLTNDPLFVPTEQPVDDQTAPAAPTGFAVTAGNAQNTLNWNNPADADFTKAVIRYRTDGKYPVSPSDGFAATEKPAAPGSSDSYLHTGLANGTTYYYSVFAVDASGNASSPARAQATPVGVFPPTAPLNVRVR
jgi:hypothetical protein